MPKNNTKPYTAADLRTMRSMARNGATTSQVAKKLGRSPGALRYKAHVAGVSFRELRAA